MLDSDSLASPYKRIYCKYIKYWWTPYLGVFYTFLSSVTILLTSVFVKKLTYISPGQLSLVRNLGVFFGGLPIAIYSTHNVFGPKKYFWLLVVRSFIGATSLYLNLLAFRHLPLAEASIILSTVPAFVTLIARIHLKEPCRLIQVASITLTILGVLISIRLPEFFKTETAFEFSREYAIGLASAWICVFLIVFMMVTMRKMHDIHFSIILLYFGALGSLENGLILVLTSSYECPRCEVWDSVQMVLIGVLGWLGYCFIVLAIQREIISTVSTCNAAFDILLSAVFQIAFFNSVPDFYELCGGFLVIVAMSLIGVWKWLLTQPADSPYRKRLKWFLL